MAILEIILFSNNKSQLAIRKSSQYFEYSFPFLPYMCTRSASDECVILLLFNDLSSCSDETDKYRKRIRRHSTNYQTMCLELAINRILLLTETFYCLLITIHVVY